MPLTTALVGFIFGPVHLTMLNGIVFFGHQVGSFFGGWGGGNLFDLQGNYDMMWWISIALGIVSALLHWPIVEERLPRRRRGAAAGMTHRAGARSSVGRRRPGRGRDRGVVRPVGPERPGLSDRPDRGLLPLVAPS